MPAQERKIYPAIVAKIREEKTLNDICIIAIQSYCLVVEEIMSREVMFSHLVHLLLMKPFFFLPTCNREGIKEIFFASWQLRL
jgi:hypothetical protein